MDDMKIYVRKWISLLLYNSIYIALHRYNPLPVAPPSSFHHTSLLYSCITYINIYRRDPFFTHLLTSSSSWIIWYYRVNMDCASMMFLWISSFPVFWLQYASIFMYCTRRTRHTVLSTRSTSHSWRNISVLCYSVNV